MMVKERVYGKLLESVSPCPVHQTTYPINLRHSTNSPEDMSLRFFAPSHHCSPNFVGVHWIAFDRVILFLPLLAARKGLLFVDFDLKSACLLTRRQKHNCSGMIV